MYYNLIKILTDQIINVKYIANHWCNNKICTSRRYHLNVQHSIIVTIHEQH